MRAKLAQDISVSQPSVIAGQGRWDEAQIVVQSLESGERTVVVRGGSDARYVPTGHLVYVLEDVLFAIPFDLTTLEVSGGPVAIVQGMARAPSARTGTGHFSFSTDGSLVHIVGGGTSIANRIPTMKPVYARLSVAALQNPDSQSYQKSEFRRRRLHSGSNFEKRSARCARQPTP